MSWNDFKERFQKCHVPTGLIKMMHDKFRNLRQGSMSVVEYMERFTDLARYAPDEVDTEAKKKEQFLNGLHDEMQCVLVAMPFTNLDALVDAAIMMENKRKVAYENRKRKMLVHQGSSSKPKGT
jgi:hypothetical protein